MQSRRRKLLKIASFIVVLSMVWVSNFHFFDIANTVSAASINDLQDEYNRLEQQQREIQEKMKQTESEQAAEQERQNQLDEQIQVTQDQIDLLTQQIAQINEELEQKEQDIALKTEELNETTEQFKQRMRAMYMSEDPSMLSILFESEGIGDFLSRVEMVRRVSEHDNELIDTLERQRTELEEEKAQVEQDKKALEDSQAAMEVKQQQLNAAYEESQNAVLDLQRLEERYQANKEQIDAEMAQAEEEIQEAIRAAQGSSGDSAAEGVPIQAEGTFIWPVPGYTNITSGFGYRWGTTHKGIDISSGGIYGKTIVASDSGTVIKVVTNDIPGYSYGKYVMIDHGGGRVTLYGHCSAILVSTGQQVTQGQAIARVGNTGNSTGPHCHFEVRINGVAQNPLNYVSP